MQMSNNTAETDMSGYEILYRTLYPRLFAYAKRFVSSEDVARDIVQDSFLKFYERKYDLKEVSASSLLFVIVRNSCIDYLRRKKLIQMEPIDFLAQINGEERLYHIDFGFTPQDDLVYDELKDQVEHVLKSLPPKCREVFVMSRFEGLKNREIAERINTTEANVEKHITKALRCFTEYFQKHCSMEAYLAILAWLLRI